ncbi:MAG: LysR family transcriptional regulator [Alphaproteobacteria bacterium]
MSIRRLRMLIAIAETGSFAAAADKMLISPSAVSQQMRTLEDELRAEIFDRRTRPPVLNRDGYALVPQAKEVVASYDAMIRSLQGAETPEGELALGAIPTTLTELVPQVLKRMRDEYPLLHFRVIPDLSSELMAQVDRGALDGAVISEPDRVPVTLDFLAVAQEPLVLLTARDVTGDEPEAILAAHPFIRFTRRAWTGRDIDDWLQARKVPVREIMELDRPEAIAMMVHHGLGVSIIPEHCVPGPFADGVRRIPLGPPAKPRAIGLIQRRDSVKARPLALFAEELGRMAQGWQQA